MLTSETHIRVRYGETDQMGYVYYGFYAQYYEVGRVEMLRDVGLTYRKLEASGVMMPVMEMTCKYLRPGKYDDLLKIKTTVDEMPDRDIEFHYQIVNEAEKCINEGRVKLCFVDIQTGRRVRCPEILSERMSSYFE